MIAEDFGSVRTRSLERALATESIAGTTVEVARAPTRFSARTGPKDRCEGAAQARHSRGQRSLQSLKPIDNLCNHRICRGFGHGIKRSGEKCGLGLSVVVDAVNPIEYTRNLWRHAASRCGARLVEIELVCSDEVEHRRRVESRTADIPGFVLPTWSDVQDRECEPWTTAEAIDTAGRTVDETIARMVACLSAAGRMP